MKVYKVKVNGKVYEVELMEVTEKDGSIATSTPSIEASNDGDEVRSFIQGTVTDIYVSIGDEVNEGQELLSIEAMKMQNHIVAPFNGVIKNILVEKQERVENQQVLIIMS